MVTQLYTFIPLVTATAVVSVLLWGLYWLLLSKHQHLSSDQKLPRQLVLLFATIAGVVAIVLVLPVSESSRNQVIGLIGVLISGVIAFSSTTIVSNFMAGLVLRINKPFRIGDFIRVNGHAGRVAEMGLLDTEIQTETRELIAIANSVLISDPVSVVRSSGAIISVELSLGYEIHHSIIEKHLIDAAKACELEEPFVQVIGLGDFSVSYRLAGLLTDVKSMLSARSKLHKAVLDHLHQANIEIVSPGFINQRPQPAGSVMIPAPPQQVSPSKEDATPEAILFDKANEAEEKDREKADIEQQIIELQVEIDATEGEQKATLKDQIEQLKVKLTALQGQQNDVASQDNLKE